jgi:hypothetical protein
MDVTTTAEFDMHDSRRSITILDGIHITRTSRSFL